MRGVSRRGEMDGGGGSRHAGAPRTLDVQKFANARGAEVQALHAVLKETTTTTTTGIGDVPRCLRRRTTSHNRRKAFFWQRKQKKKRKPGAEQEEEAIDAEGEAAGGDAAVSAKKPPCRRVRRRIELKGDDQGGGGCSSDGTQRLVTHVWHAKRFTMTKIWGHWLAEGLPGRGRGSRAIIRWVREAAVLQDASFYSAIELEGSQKSITEALQLVLEPAPKSVVNSEDQAVYSGAEYGKATLHHIDRCPCGAIAPVTFLWRPELKAGENRRIWLWVHAAAFEEALACLQNLCETQGLQCWSRKGQLGRLDLVGSKAAATLQKVLHPIARQASEEGSVESVPPSSCNSSSSAPNLEDCHQFPGRAVIGMEVWDPRGHSHSDTTFQPSILVDAGADEMEVEDMDITVSNSGHPSTNNEVDVHSSITNPILQRETLQRPNHADETERKLACNREMWDRLDITGQESIVKPSSEKVLSTRRHKERLSYIQLNDISEDTKEEPCAASERLKCPVLILKHAHQRPSASGFSLILPVAWVRAFWVPLVFAGGRVVGLRERHWLDTDAKLPSFPYDYPDCSSYDRHMARKATEDQETYNRKPPSKRGLWKSGLPDWNFEYEASPFCSKNRSTAQGVSRAEFGSGTPSLLGENSESVFKNTSIDIMVCPSSTSPEAPSTQLNCSSVHHVLTTASGTGISDMTGVEISIIDSNKPSNGDLAPAEIIPRDAVDDCTSAPMMEVVHEGLTSDHTVGLQEHPPQVDLVSDSQSIPSTTEGQNRECDTSTAVLHASSSAQSVRPSQEVNGQVENPSNLKDESVRASIGESKALKVVDYGKSSTFVARSREAVEKFLNDCNLHHLPLLTNYKRPTNLIGDGSTELAKTGCLVRVLVHAPRKGVFDSGAIIYLPLPSDVHSYFSLSQRWQGFDDPNFKQIQQSFLNKKKRKQKAKGVQKTMSSLQGSTYPQNTACPAGLPEPKSESCSSRVPIGIITSGYVRGSTSSASIGICEVAALGVLRAKQMALDERSPSSEVLVLVRNTSSSMFRPALVLIEVEALHVPMIMFEAWSRNA